MFTLHDSILIHAPIERCWDLSRSIEIVHRELGMSAVAGRTSGLVEAGDLIRWEGWQLGWRRVHVSRISGFQPPTFLQDTMAEGRFASFQHDHWLQPHADGTLLRDELRFSMPWGIAGHLAGKLILVPHIRGLMRRRFYLLKRIAESDEWKLYLR